MKKLFDLSGHKVLVTGSSRGIGKEISLGLAKCGADVVIHYVKNKEKAEEVVKEIRNLKVKSYSICSDLSIKGSTKKIYEQAKKLIGDIDILILSAAIHVRNNWMNITKEEFVKQFNVNIWSTFELIRLFVPNMINNQWGRIITIGSIQQVKPLSEMIMYASTKEAQLSFVRTLASELGSEGITVNNLAPGVIETDRNRKVLSNDVYNKHMLSQIPSNYIGETKDCVGAAILLSSDEGRYINGENLWVDGGMHL